MSGEHASPGSLQPAAEGGEWKEPDDQPFHRRRPTLKNRFSPSVLPSRRRIINTKLAVLSARGTEDPEAQRTQRQPLLIHLLFGPRRGSGSCVRVYARVREPLCLHLEARVRQAALAEASGLGAGLQDGGTQTVRSASVGSALLALRELAALPGSGACGPGAGAPAFSLCVEQKGVCSGRPVWTQEAWHAGVEVGKQACAFPGASRPPPLAASKQGRGVCGGQARRGWTEPGRSSDRPGKLARPGSW